MDNLLQKLLELWTPEEQAYGGGFLRLSSSGYGARKLAFDLRRYPKEPLLPRTVVNFEYGDLVHDYMRDFIAEHGEGRYEVLDRELTVVSSIASDNPEINGTKVEGHVDLRLKDTEDDIIYLVDIKSIGHTGYIYSDPMNGRGKKKPNRYHKSRNYTFDALKNWTGDPFKESYLFQLASYMDAGLEFDEAVFVLVNKATGHIAVGQFDVTEDVLDEFLDDRDQRFEQAITTDPYDLPTCVPVTEGKTVPLTCGYCDYKHACLKLSGRAPKYKVVKIRQEPDEATQELLQARPEQEDERDVA